MWYPLNSNPPHTYLNSSVKDVKQRILNRAVDRVEGRTSTTYNLEPPFLRLASAIPCIYGPHVDVTRSKLAFGHWALPKLRRELHDADPLIVRQAVNSIADLVHDPEQCFEAVRLDVVKRIQDMLQHHEAFIRERCAMIVATMAGQAEGRKAIGDHPGVMASLRALVVDPVDAVRHKSAIAVEMISRSPFGAESLNEHDFMPLLLKNLIGEEQDLVAVHLATLEALQERTLAVKKQALELGALDVYAYLTREACTEVCLYALANLAQVVSHPDGQKMAAEKDLMPLIQLKLEDERREVHTKAAAVMMYMTVITPSKLRAVSLHMIPRLLDLAADFHCHELQVNCIKALTNICEAPIARQILLDNYQAHVEALQCQGQEHLERHRATLLRVIRWKP